MSNGFGFVGAVDLPDEWGDDKQLLVVEWWTSASGGVDVELWDGSTSPGCREWRLSLSDEQARQLVALLTQATSVVPEDDPLVGPFVPEFENHLQRQRLATLIAHDEGDR